MTENQRSLLTGFLVWVGIAGVALQTYVQTLDGWGDWSWFTFWKGAIPVVLTGVGMLAKFFGISLSDKVEGFPKPEVVLPTLPDRDDETLFTTEDYEAPVKPVAPQTQIPPVTPLQPARNWFSDAEMDCKCQDLPGCDYRGMHKTVMAMVNDLRDRFGPLIVTSGYRCPDHNKQVGGVPSSYHVKGMAVDLKSATVPAAELYAYLDAKYPEQYGIGCYSTFIHCDCRTDAWARKTGPAENWKQFVNPDVNLAPA